MALFETEAQVRDRERKERAVAANSADPNRSAFTELGFALGGAAIRGVGEAVGDPQDTRSHAEVKASLLQEQIKGLDFSNRKSVFSTAQKLKDEGNFAEAVQVLQLMPDVAAETWGAPRVHEAEIDNEGRVTKRKFTTITSSLGNVKTVDSFTGLPEKETDPGVGRGNEGLKRYSSAPITLSESMRGLVDKNFVDIANKRNGAFGLPEMDTTGVVGKIELLAARMQVQELEQQQVAAYNATKNPDGSMNNAAFNDMMALYIQPSAQDFAQRAINLTKKSGDADNYVEINKLYDDIVDVDTSQDNTPEELQAKEVINAHKLDAQAQDAMMREQFVEGAVAKGELNLRDVDLDAGTKAFQGFDKKTDEQLAANFEAMGIPVGNGEAYASHRRHWGWMRSQPEYTAAWLGAISDDARKSMHFDFTEKMADEGRMEEFYRAERINDYLGKMKQTDKLQPRDALNPAKVNLVSGLWNYFWGDANAQPIEMPEPIVSQPLQ